MEKATIQKIEETVVALCEWIQETASENATPDTEHMPGVIEATAGLAQVLVGYDHERVMRATGRSGQS